MTTEERLDRLERRLDEINARLSRVGLTGAGPTEIYANRIGLEDKNGKVRVGLCVRKDKTVLFMADKNGNPRATLSVDKGGPVLDLSDENGKTVWQAP